MPEYDHGTKTEIDYLSEIAGSLSNIVQILEEAQQDQSDVIRALKDIEHKIS